ncbi:NERD domain-containing protein [Motiliproteus sp.]|uniref:nuclease-related domain-containing protein n=1 Tax=Motiliproteus sp. TaxID=1898955 RepID=UPI003BA96B34
MDFSPIFDALLSMWYLIPLFILVGVSRSPWFKGFIGEAIVNLAARFFLDKKQYHLIKNVTLPTDDGTTQIDHIIVSRFGVFVIETKNMKGWIFGSANQPYWTQQIFKHKSKFQNPLRQNYKHVKTLEAALEIEPSHIHSLIVFVGDSTFKTDMPENVTYAGGYIRYIKSRRDPVLSDVQVRLIIQKIEKGRLTRSIKTHVQHAKHVQEIVEKKSSEPLCPRCSSPMVLRESKKGQNIGKQFWGCSQFPRCRVIKDKEDMFNF